MTGAIPMENYYSRNRLAKTLGVDPTTIIRWEKSGRMPVAPTKQYNMIHYTESDLVKIRLWRDHDKRNVGTKVNKQENEVLCFMRTDETAARLMVSVMNEAKERTRLSIVDDFFGKK